MSTPGTPVTPKLNEADVDHLLERLEKVRPRNAPYLVLGLLAVVLGLAVLTVQLNRMRADAVTRADAATAAFNENARILSQAKAALAAGDRSTLSRLLNVAAIEAERAAEGAALPTGAATDVRVATGPAQASAEAFAPLPADAAFTQKVFIHFAGLIQRSDVAAVNQALKTAGWNMQGADGERIGTAAGLNEVRFSTEADRPAAEALARALTAARLGGSPVTTKQMRIIHPGTLEAWISNT